MDCSMPGLPVHPNSKSPPKPMSIESVMPSTHLILCHLLLLLPSTFPSIRVFSNELALRIRWPKDWSFSFSISHSNEYSELISFRIDWFDLLAVQRTEGSLAGYSPWGYKESDTSEQLTHTKLNNDVCNAICLKLKLY